MVIINGEVTPITVVAAGAIAFTMIRATDYTSKNMLSMNVSFAGGAGSCLRVVSSG
ncbi:MAG: hypothetical protein JRM85_01090 [Nitrososphaerota archaeon]|nr:hypothetical protein [Nitrososphaerota archaeon]MDG6919740.1 hypothetical protein [Nitrososphaerota archaeon]